MWLRNIFGPLVCIAAFGNPTKFHAIYGLDGAVREQPRSGDDPQALLALSKKIQRQGTCSVCHHLGLEDLATRMATQSMPC